MKHSGVKEVQEKIKNASSVAKHANPHLNKVSEDKKFIDRVKSFQRPK